MKSLTESLRSASAYINTPILYHINQIERVRLCIGNGVRDAYHRVVSAVSQAFDFAVEHLTWQRELRIPSGLLQLDARGPFPAVNSSAEAGDKEEDGRLDGIGPSVKEYGALDRRSLSADEVKLHNDAFRIRLESIIATQQTEASHYVFGMSFSSDGSRLALTRFVAIMFDVHLSTKNLQNLRIGDFDATTLSHVEVNNNCFSLPSMTLTQ